MAEDTPYKFVKCPVFNKYGANGVITETRCKLCGEVIAESADKVISRVANGDGTITERIQTGMRRKDTYRELLIEFDDGSAHMTHGCSKCLVDGLKPNRLDELHRADMEEARFIGYREQDHVRKAVGIRSQVFPTRRAIRGAGK